MKLDVHCHTDCSDGNLSIEERIDIIRRLGMQYSDFAPWPVREAIELIHSAGGYAVLAHPAGAGDRVMGELGFLVHDESH